MNESSTRWATPEGRLCVSGAPNLPGRFTDTFTNRYVDTAWLRQHVVIGGADRVPVLAPQLTSRGADGPRPHAAAAFRSLRR